MAKVSSIAQGVRDLTGGLDQSDVTATTVRALIAALEARYPGLGEHVNERMALAIDGELYQDAMSELLRPDSEVVLIPKISGG